MCLRNGNLNVFKEWKNVNVFKEWKCECECA